MTAVGIEVCREFEVSDVEWRWLTEFRVDVPLTSQNSNHRATPTCSERNKHKSSEHSLVSSAFSPDCSSSLSIQRADNTPYPTWMLHFGNDLQPLVPGYLGVLT